MAARPRPSLVLMTADGVAGIWTYALELARDQAERAVAGAVAPMGRARRGGRARDHGRPARRRPPRGSRGRPEPRAVREPLPPRVDVRPLGRRRGSGGLAARPPRPAAARPRPPERLRARRTALGAADDRDRALLRPLLVGGRAPRTARGRLRPLPARGRPGPAERRPRDRPQPRDARQPPPPLRAAREHARDRVGARGGPLPAAREGGVRPRRGPAVGRGQEPHRPRRRRAQPRVAGLPRGRAHASRGRVGLAPLRARPRPAGAPRARGLAGARVHLRAPRALRAVRPLRARGRARGLCARARRHPEPARAVGRRGRVRAPRRPPRDRPRHPRPLPGRDAALAPRCRPRALELSPARMAQDYLEAYALAALAHASVDKEISA